MPNYSHFLTRLRAYERYEPAPRSRGPEKLAGVRRLLADLGNPAAEYRVIHVAGTNGKGMTATMIAELLRQAGQRVGLFTSPHLVEVRERIAVAGAPIAKATLATVGHEVLHRADALRSSGHLSYFDVLTAIGLTAFAREQVQWVVLETGLGGRSDATNITEKEAAVITRIGLDHRTVLGPTLHHIAGEKLGIARAGVPTVLAAQPEGLAPWMRERLIALGSPVHEAARARFAPHPPGALTLEMGGESLRLPPPHPPATGPRLECAATALAAAEVVLGPATGQALRARAAAALNTALPGRLELRADVALRAHPHHRFPRVVLDGGHNPEALAALADHLNRWNFSGYTLIFGMQTDKMVPEVLAPLGRLLVGARRVITLAPQTPRSPQPAALHDFLARSLAPRPLPAPPRGAGSPTEALLLAPADEPLVIAGSFWMMGDLMGVLEPPEPCWHSDGG